MERFAQILAIACCIFIFIAPLLKILASSKAPGLAKGFLESQEFGYRVIAGVLHSNRFYRWMFLQHGWLVMQFLGCALPGWLIYAFAGKAYLAIFLVSCVSSTYRSYESYKRVMFYRQNPDASTGTLNLT